MDKEWRPMYVMRCMSREEFDRYRKGETLRNLSVHQGQATDAIGFCFFPVSQASETVEERIRYLAGVASLEVVAVFVTEPGIYLHRATGVYRNPKRGLEARWTYESLARMTMRRTEFCTTVYDKETLRLVAYGTPHWIDSGGWFVQWHKGGNQVRRLENGT